MFPPLLQRGPAPVSPWPWSRTLSGTVSSEGHKFSTAFAGSGTTLIAAEKTGRRGYGIEIDPAYCDVTICRLHAVCGLGAVLYATRTALCGDPEAFAPRPMNTT